MNTSFSVMTRNIASEEKKFIQERVYQQYVDDCVTRLRVFTIIVAIGELVLMFLDFEGNFFSEHRLNLLNLVAEIMLIFFSTIHFFIFSHLKKQEQVEPKKALRSIVLYRIIVMAAIVLFISTDVYVRHQALGAYMVFLFVLQITPAFEPRINYIQFGCIGFITIVEYIIFVAKNLNTIFATLVIFCCFAISADFIRRYSVRQLENYYLAEFNNQRYKALSEQSILALASAVEAKDLYTKGHSQRVAEYSREIAKRLGYQDRRCREVYFIGLMHDVGKIGVPDSVINKNGRLTDEEFDEIKKHPAVGYEILKQITELPGISEGARWHHERYDGKGYPDHLSGEKIPEIARIIAVADAYDAMTSNRSYRGAMPQDVVRKQIADNAGTQFDPNMADMMLNMIDEDIEYKMREAN